MKRRRSRLTAAGPVPAAFWLLGLVSGAGAQVSAPAAVPAAPAGSAASEPAGRVTFKRGNVTVKAASIKARLADEQVRASGQVELQRPGQRITGADLDLNTQTQMGYVLGPHFLLTKTQAGGQAERLDFLGPERLAATRASYSSCPMEPDVEPAWQLTTRKLTMDMAANEGVAENAVLRFYGVPILAAPTMSFPVTEARKSGLLAPLLSLSNTSGLEFGTPYYLNLAPNRDATFTPIYSTRRGAALDSEFRYLAPQGQGVSRLFLLPSDQLRGGQRWAFSGQHDGELQPDLAYDARWLRASDDDYWRDGLRGAPSLTPRLLPAQAGVEQRRFWDTAGGEVEQRVYARVTQWQVLQDVTATTHLTEPYRRLPQVGARWRSVQGDLDWSAETEVNHFTHADPALAQGTRAHMLGAVALPLGDAGWRVTPRLGVNAAAYDLGATAGASAQRRSRLIPTLSVDSQWTFDRQTELFGRALTQTLEPRLLYVNTPWRDQAGLPLFDSAALDFNPTSVYLPSVFSGVDRVSDANQITAGISTRFLSRTDGAEVARLGIAQRFLLRDQRITPDDVPLTKRFSDLLLFGSTSAVSNWHMDGVVQYNPEVDRVARSILNLRYSPGPFRTLSTSYRYQRNASEQLALGWQWPLWGVDHEPLWPVRAAAAAGTDAAAGGARRAGGARDCSGTLYGIGRLEYSMSDRRLSGAIMGVEYDAGCWIGRIVAQRKSTGAQAQSTSLSFQLELIGLTRIDVGTNPLTLLKDNIPGFRLLNDPATGRSAVDAGAANGTVP